MLLRSVAAACLWPAWLGSPHQDWGERHGTPKNGPTATAKRPETSHVLQRQGKDKATAKIQPAGLLHLFDKAEQTSPGGKMEQLPVLPGAAEPVAVAAAAKTLKMLKKF